MIASQTTSTKQSILLCLRKQGPATAQALAEHLHISPQAIRRHLKDLETEGLIHFQVAQEGLGRPHHIYQLSDAAAERFPDSYDRFAMGLLNTLVETVGSDQMGSILHKQWQQKGLAYRQALGSGSLSERLLKLVELRRQEGYMAECQPYPRQEILNSQYLLTEHHCAISQIAQTFPTVCGHELEMFATALPDCQVERITWLAEGKSHCGYLISLQSPQSIA
ncbi:MAG: iron-sulfur cluster biosynthesis transcriptional regulator SufR [Cyanobacteriota bacterium]|nr:iron-sulfur cluster biosynthesis transcriptional regulator SufR [Cyanobacteriota bacterium]